MFIRSNDQGRAPEPITVRCRRCGEEHPCVNGAALRQEREAAGVSLREMERRTGINRGVLSGVERNLRAASADLLERFRAALARPEEE